MYAIKRIIAYAIDLVIAAVITAFSSGFAAQFLLSEEISPLKAMLFSYGSLGLSLGVPVIVFGCLSGLLGWTPGKLCLFLRVQNSSGRPPGLAQGILREMIKAISFSFLLLGSLWALYGIVAEQKTFYDDWLSLDVADLKPSGLTETQRKWREYHRKR